MRLCCTAQFVAALCLAGCGTVELFGTYDLPESPSVASADWPRLADVPDAPPVGSYSPAVPDPEIGRQTDQQLTDTALVAGIRARELSQPVISDADRRQLARGKRVRQ